MNKNTSLDFDSIKNMTVDILMKKAQNYVKRYLSESDSKSFIKAYRDGDYEEAKKILDATYKVMSNKLKPIELITAKAIIDKLFFKSSTFDADKGGQHKKMNEVSGGVMAFIIICVAILVVAALIGIGIAYWKNKSNNTVGEVLTTNSVKRRSSPKQTSYTDEDMTMLELIHELAKVYKTTDEYMGS